MEGVEGENRSSLHPIPSERQAVKCPAEGVEGVKGLFRFWPNLGASYVIISVFSNSLPLFEGTPSKTEGELLVSKSNWSSSPVLGEGDRKAVEELVFNNLWMPNPNKRAP